MSSGRKGLRPETRSQTAQKSMNLAPLKRGKRSRDNSAPASAPRYATRPGLRSGFRPKPTAEFARTFRVNPEEILRKPRKSQKGRETTQLDNQGGNPSLSHPESIVQSIESPLGEEPKPINNNAAIKVPDHETPPSSPATDPAPLQTFHRRLPPLHQESNNKPSLPPPDPDRDPEQTLNRSRNDAPPPNEGAAAATDENVADAAMAEQSARIDIGSGNSIGIGRVGRAECGMT